MKKIKILSADNYFILEVKAGATTYFKEKTEEFTTEKLRYFLQKIIPDAKVRNEFFKSVLNLKNSKNKILTVEENGKWYKESNASAYNRIKSYCSESSTENLNPKAEIKESQDVSSLLINELLKLTEKDPDDDKSLNKLGIAYIELKRFDDAIDVLREAISLNHDNEEYYLNLGRAYYLSGRYDLAGAEYKEALNINKENFQACFELGNAFYAGGKLHEAIAPYHNSIILNPEYIPAYMKLGELYNELEYPDEAIYTFQTVMYLDPENEEALVKMGVSNHIKKKLLATEYNNLGIAYAERGKLDKAIEKFKLSLEINYNDYEVHFNLAIAYIKNRNPEKAIDSLKESIKLKNDFPEARNELANIYRSQGNHKQAVKEYTEYLRLENEPERIKEIQGIIKSIS